MPVIPPKSNRTEPVDYDKDLYKLREKVERFFNKLKQFRRIATRYEKLSHTFLALFISLRHGSSQNNSSTRPSPELRVTTGLRSYSAKGRGMFATPALEVSRAAAGHLLYRVRQISVFVASPGAQRLDKSLD